MNELESKDLFLQIFLTTSILTIKLELVECGSDSSVGIATDYGLDGPGIDSRCGPEFPPF